MRLSLVHYISVRVVDRLRVAIASVSGVWLTLYIILAEPTLPYSFRIFLTAFSSRNYISLSTSFPRHRHLTVLRLTNCKHTSEKMAKKFEVSINIQCYVVYTHQSWRLVLLKVVNSPRNGTIKCIMHVIIFYLKPEIHLNYCSLLSLTLIIFSTISRLYSDFDQILEVNSNSVIMWLFKTNYGLCD